MDARRVAVLTEARSWMAGKGTRWHHRACVKGAGVDCGLFVKACFVNASLVEDFESGYYPADWMKHRSDEVLLDWLERYCVRVDKPEPADIAAWKFGLCFSHAAVVVEWPMVIHAYLPERKVVITDASRGPLAQMPADKDTGDAAQPRPVRFYSRIARLS